MNPLLSVITVVYNNASFIQEAINSVILTKLPNTEYIIIDGGSTDGTVPLVEAYGTQITKFVSEPDAGIYDAMNKGINFATGDYISFINADDYYEHKSLEKITEKLDLERPDVLYADLDYIDNNRQVRRCWRPGSFDKKKLQDLWISPHPTTFIRRDLIQKFSGFDIKYKLAADYDLLLKVLSSAEKVIYFDTVVVKMRLGGATNVTWQNIFKQNMEIFRSYRSHFNSYPLLKFLNKLVNRLVQITLAKIKIGK